MQTIHAKTERGVGRENNTQTSENTVYPNRLGNRSIARCDGDVSHKSVGTRWQVMLDPISTLWEYIAHMDLCMLDIGNSGSHVSLLLLLEALGAKGLL